MTYKEAIKEQCEKYAKDPAARFIGYNTVYGSRMYGTLDGVDVSQCVEMPVAENLMVGMAMGMSMMGFKPVVCFERHDFMLLALDAMVNQMDKMPWLSGDAFKYPIVIRAIVGSRSPMDPGPMHRQNYTRMLQDALKHTPVMSFASVWGLGGIWKKVGKTGSGAIVVVEYKDDYELDIDNLT